jgi:lipase
VPRCRVQLPRSLLGKEGTLSLPIVLVHGLIGSFTGERTVALPYPALVLSPDLLGYGTQADVTPEDITIEAQVEYLRAAADRAAPGGRVHLAGHSVGGVIAMSFAHRFPARVAGVVNVEGNFTLDDAFWSAQLATKTPSEVYELLAADRADPARWLREAGMTPTSERIRAAARALAYQPATTLQATARAVVDFTGRAGYEHLLREVFARTPVHLVAGARSRAGWHVPAWALTAAASYTEVPGAGHMVMLEAPEVMEQILTDLMGDDPPHYNHA